MKIGDIITGKKQKDNIPEINNSMEGEQLKQMRNQMEQELRQQIQKEQQVHEPVMIDKGNQAMEEMERDLMEQEMMQQQRQQPQQPPKPELPPGMDVYKMTVFLDNGQKLPVRFVAKDDEVTSIIKELDLLIEAEKVVTIGDFKIVGSKILYIDLLGR